MKTLEDYENKIDHLNAQETINHKLYLNLKEKVGNMIGRKYEHESFLIDEIAKDINDNAYDKKYDDTYEEKRILLNKLNNHTDVIDGIDYFDFLELLQSI